MSYRVKEMFYSLQGEGFHAGRPALFCRFSHCNLWTGREEDRANAVCRFCDTDFVGTDGQNGGRFVHADELVERLLSLWPDSATRPFVVLTGGEPLLQVDSPLLRALHAANAYVAVETNGTLRAPAGIDWLTVSPKVGAPFIQREGDELKLVYPQPGLSPDALGETNFAHFFLQPMDGPQKEVNTRAALAYCLHNPKWRLSVQLHKWLNID